MAQELTSLIKVTACTAATMAYVRTAALSTNPGITRLLAFLPAILFLPSLPWHLSTLHLRTASAFFLVWLAVFKLLLLAFGSYGPLSPSLPLLPFIASASLPVKFSPSNKPPAPLLLRRYLLPTAIKLLTLAVLLYLYRFKFFPYFLVLAGYNLHLYLSMDLVLSTSAFLTSLLLRIDVDPQFQVPYISGSLQDFWGRRWNLMATDILRPSVYEPVRARYGTYAGIVATFAVSGVMHEVLFYYLGIPGPRGEAFGFFALQGMCTAVEVKARREKWWWPRPAVATLLSVWFVMATASCLLFQPILRSTAIDQAVEETMAVVRFFGSGVRAVLRGMWGFYAIICGAK